MRVGEHHFLALQRAYVAVFCRFQMQYSFIYQALLEYYLYGDTELDVSSLEKHLQTSHNAAPNLVKIGLEEEFKVSMNVLYCRLSKCGSI